LADAARATVHQSAAALPQVSVQDFSDDMMSLMAAADVVVAMGGYNTVCELLTLRKRAVLVPRVLPGQEQAIRAERMAALGLVRTLHPSRLTPEALMAAIGRELAGLVEGREPPRLKSLGGLQRCTTALLAQLGLKADARTPCAAASGAPVQRREARGAVGGEPCRPIV
jgi:predicted glycosyltransferase